MRRELPRESVCYLLESTELWGGVKAVFDQAERLARSGWSVSIATKAGPPDWRELSVPVVTVPHFGYENLPPASCYVGTFWSTVEPAYIAGGGACVHLCQGYEGDLVEHAEHLVQIEQAYRLPTFKIATALHLCRLIEERFGQECRLVRYAIDSGVFHANGRSEADGRLPRVVVVGPFEVGVKRIPTALTALRLLRESRTDFEVVRISQHAQSEPERGLLEADEYHVHLREQDVAEVMRTCDIVLSASSEEEGFGLPVLEAMACGCAAVVSDIRAYRGFGDAIGGWEPYAVFCPPDKAEAFAAAAGRLLADPAERASLAASGGTLAKRYDAPEIEELLVAVMDEALNACRPEDDDSPPAALPRDSERMHWRDREEARSLRRMNQEAEAGLARLRAAIGSREHEIAARDQELANRDAEIANRDQEIANREQELARRAQAIADRDREIAQLRAQLSGVESELVLAAARVDDAEAHLAAWRARKLARPLVAVDAAAERLAPPGTRRRRLIRRTLAALRGGG